MKWFLAFNILFFIGFTAKAKEKGLLELIEAGNVLWGKKAYNNDLQGRVILWVNSHSIREDVARFKQITLDLEKLNEEFVGTFKFAAVSSFLDDTYFIQRLFNTEEKAVLKVPCCHELKFSSAPEKGTMYLFDHKGRLIVSRSMTDKNSVLGFKTEIKKVLVKTPLPKVHPFSSIEIKHNDIKSLILGRQIKSTLVYLQQSARKDNDKGREAKVIVKAVEDWSKNEKERINKLLETEPSTTMPRLELFVRTFQGMSVSADLAKKLSALKRDRGLTQLIQLRKRFEALEIKKKISESDKKNLISYLNKYKTSAKNDTYAKDAENMIKEIEDF